MVIWVMVILSGVLISIGIPISMALGLGSLLAVAFTGFSPLHSRDRIFPTSSPPPVPTTYPSMAINTPTGIKTLL